MLGVAIRERQIGPLIMPVRWQVDPEVDIAQDAESGIDNIIFVNIDEDEYLIR